MEKASIRTMCSAIYLLADEGGLARLLAQCESEKGQIVNVREVHYPRHARGMEDWAGHMITVALQSGGSAEIILGPSIEPLMKDRALEEPAQLTGMRIITYRFPEEKHPIESFVGISLDQ